MIAISCPDLVPAFQQGYLTYLNPSYFAPYSFRLFAEVDPDRDWLSLVDTSYDALTHSAQISTIGLPSDWVGLDITTGKYQPLAPSLPLRSIYSFDAYRVWWRVSLDYLLFDAPEAKVFLDTHLATVAEQWQADGKLAATINRAGEPMVDYEATGQYAHALPCVSDCRWGDRRRTIAAKTSPRLSKRHLGQRYRLLYPEPGLVWPSLDRRVGVRMVRVPPRFTVVSISPSLPRGPFPLMFY